MFEGQGTLDDLAIFLLAEDRPSGVLVFNNSFIINSFGFMDTDYAKQILRKTVADYDSIAAKYSTVREKDWKEFDFLFEKYLNSGEKVLDLGCGNGRFHDSFTRKDVRYIGVDPSVKLIDIARKKYPSGNFQVAAGESLPFSEGYFDSVWSIAVLHHIPSEALRLEFLKESGRIVKKGGYLILTVWDLKEKAEKGRGLFYRFKARKLEKGDVFLPWYGSRDTYFHCFNREELVQLVKGSGFEIVEEGKIEVGLKPYSNIYIVAKK